MDLKSFSLLLFGLSFCSAGSVFQLEITQESNLVCGCGPVTKTVKSSDIPTKVHLSCELLSYDLKLDSWDGSTGKLEIEADTYAHVTHSMYKSDYLKTATSGFCDMIFQVDLIDTDENGGTEEPVYSESHAYFATLYFAASNNDPDPASYDHLPSTFEVVQDFTFPMGHDTKVFGYVGIDHTFERVVAAFEGTTLDNLQILDEIIGALKFYEVGSGSTISIEVFPYFQDAWAGLDGLGLSALVDQLLRDNPTYHFWATGHSLGGALASVGAFTMAVNGIIPHTSTLFTFGQPRTGNFEYAMAVDATLPDSWRIVNNRDVISHSPPCKTSTGVIDTGHCISGGPYHHGTEVWYPSTQYENGVMCGHIVCTTDPKDESADCSDSLTTPDSITDHTEGYYEIIDGGFCKDGVPLDTIASINENPEPPIKLWNVIVVSVVTLSIVVLAAVYVLRRKRRAKESLAEEYQLLEEPATSENISQSVSL